MIIKRIGVNTESESYFEETEDEIWILNDKGELIKMEDDEDEDNSEGQ